MSALQAPKANVPHFPIGVPKLAKLIEVMCHPRSQVSWTSGFWDLNSEFGFQESAGGGSVSDTCAHISWPVFVLKEILEGSPPSSSWRTRRFSPICTHVRGIWYLKIIYNVFDFNMIISLLVHHYAGQHKWTKPAMHSLLQSLSWLTTVL